MSRRILLVEDELGLVLTLGDRLRSEGYALVVARDGEEGLRQALHESFDAIVLDVMLPKKSGFEVCQELRQAEVDTPILMLTARTQTTDKVRGLKIGADDYLTKPFAMPELLARLEALLRRTTPRPAEPLPTVYHFGDITVDLQRMNVSREGNGLTLSAREFELLRYLIEHRGATLSRDQLLNEVWGYHSMPSTRTVDVHVAWLRQKIESDPKRPQFIQTVHGLGYKFVG